MQVETCAVAGIAYITYNLPCRYRFPCGNGSLRHVGVPLSVSRQRPAQRAIGNGNPAAQSKQAGAHFLG